MVGFIFPHGGHQIAEIHLELQAAISVKLHHQLAAAFAIELHHMEPNRQTQLVID